MRTARMTPCRAFARGPHLQHHRVCKGGAAGGRLNKPWFSTFPHEAEIFTFQGSSRSDVEAMVELAASGHISVDAELFALSAAAEAYEKLQQGALRGRAVVIPD